MSTLYIDRKGAEVDADAGTITVRTDGERRGTVPMGPLDRVVVKGTATLTTRLIARLVERGIGLTVLAGRDARPVVQLPSLAAGDSGARLAQYALMADEDHRAALSRTLVLAKLRAQRRILAELSDAGPAPAIRDGLALLDRSVRRLDRASAPPARSTLRGIEGAAAAGYFRALATLFPPAAGFEGRNRRPPRDPVNACLSLGYTLLHGDAVRAAAAHGLDVMLGVYHDIAPGRESLACDLAEPVRPLIDRTVHTLFRDQTVRAEDFTRTKAGCRLKKSARRSVYRAFEAAAPLHRRLLDRAARRFAAGLRTRPDPPAPPALPPPPDGAAAPQDL